MKNANDIIKQAGYTTEKIHIGTYKSAFGGDRNHIIVLKNSEGKALHFEGELYSPMGRIDAFAELIKSGDINADCFSFQ